MKITTIICVLLVSCNYPQQNPESLSNDMKAAQYEKTVEIIQAAGDISRGIIQDSIEKGR